MNITLVISSLNGGGAEKVLSDLANYWSQMGHNVSFVTFSSQSSVPFYKLNSRIKIIQLNLLSKKRTVNIVKIFQILKRIYFLRKIFYELKPDIIVSFIDVMNVLTLSSVIGLNIPVIVSERSHPKYHNIPGFYGILRKLLYPKAAAVVVQTKSVLSYFSNLNNIKIIPNSISIFEENINEINEKVVKIISVGNLYFYKGFDTLIYAFSELIKEHPHLHLTIYGEGNERSNLENLIIKLGVKNYVHLAGTTKEIMKYLMGADLFIFPSRYEGFPNALCEALSVGLPVIASNCSGNIDIIEDGINGFLFPVGDINQLVFKTNELILDYNKRKNFSNNAKLISSKLNPEKIFTLWDQVLYSAINIKDSY